MPEGSFMDHDDVNARIAELALFLDPIAFGRREDRAFQKRRESAWRKAANRYARSASRAADPTRLR
jgi:hypothetical protein